MQYDQSAAKTFGANLIAERPSGSRIIGFHRPGERPKNGAPFEAQPTKLPKYNGRPSGRSPSETEKRVAWPLQGEYLAGRLGKDNGENSKLWNTVKWIDQHYRIATMSANATQTINWLTNGWQDVAEHEEIIEGFGVELIGLNALDWKRISRLGNTYDTARLIDELKELDELGKIDANKLLSECGPRPLRFDFPTAIERAESGAIVGMLQLGMRTLWTPVKRSIADHTEMFRLGQGARREIAPAVGRQRVIEGLRIADSIRKDIARQKNPVAVNEASYWPARQGRMAVVDKLIMSVLNTVADKPLPANDNFRADTIGSEAA
jgi:hypothetical protein